MEHRAVFLADFANAGNLVDGAQFVVRPHDGHQNGVVSKGVLHHLGRDDAIRPWFQERHIKAFTFQAAARVDDGFVFVHRGDDVSAMFGASGGLGVHPSRALDGDVVRFGGPRSENDFLRLGPQKIGDL